MVPLALNESVLCGNLFSIYAAYVYNLYTKQISIRFLHVKKN